jgi:glycine/D-amino acid oxidase-like deaminating enzyme
VDLHTGTPFWEQRAGPAPSHPALSRSITADVAIVGAGITGALVAFELARAGVDVVVLERAQVATGSSAATSGLLLYDTDTSLQDLGASIGPAGAARVYRLGLDAIDRIETLCQRWDGCCGFARRPSLYLASAPADVPALQRECDGRRALGLDATLLTPSDIASRYSFTAPAAIYAHGNGEVDACRLTRRLVADAEEAGARVYERSPVTALRASGGAVDLTVAAPHNVRAARVVLATGYEAATHLERPTGRLASTWVLVSQPLDHFDGWPDRCLIWETARPYLYVRSTDDGRLLAGGEDEPCADAHRRWGLLESKTARLLARARALFPRLGLDVSQAWAGTFATTDDGLPFIGESERCPGVWLALGYGGNGITFSVVAAAILRDACLGRTHDDAGLFRFDRPRRAPARPGSSAADQSS